MIDDLWEATRNLATPRVRVVLLHAVNGYKPTNGVEDLVWVTKNQARVTGAGRNYVASRSW
jgi:hypothetical protein